MHCLDMQIVQILWLGNNTNCIIWNRYSLLFSFFVCLSSVHNNLKEKKKKNNNKIKITQAEGYNSVNSGNPLDKNEKLLQVLEHTKILIIFY